MNKTVFFLVLSLSAIGAGAQENYADGVFILNEDWFGHNNSTINFWHIYGDNTIDYRVFQAANAIDGWSLGCTAEYGTVYGDKLLIVSKQDQDDGGGDALRGARFVVADAATMRLIARVDKIDVNEDGRSIADGRAVAGVDENTAYIGTSNGIYVFDFLSGMVTGRIEGTENPLITGSESEADGLGALYRNQIGTMIRTQDYVFAIQQDKGILVIDPQRREILQTIPGCFATMTLARDGNIWAGKNSNPDYQAYPYGDNGAAGEKWNGDLLLRLDPVSLETKDFPLGGGAMINQSWYAWAGGSLCASMHSNALYFTSVEVKNDAHRFITHKVFRYDIDNHTVSEVIDTKASLDRYIFMGSGLSIHPETDDLFVNMYLSAIDRNYWFCRFNSENPSVSDSRYREKQASQNYWFPAMVVYPDRYSPEVSPIPDVALTGGAPREIDLGSFVKDQDNNPPISILKTVTAVDDDLLEATVKGNVLTLTPRAGKSGSCTVGLRFNSNGRIVEAGFAASVDAGSALSPQDYSSVRVWGEKGSIQVSGLPESGVSVKVFNAAGVSVCSASSAGADLSIPVQTGQLYIIYIGTQRFKIIL